MSSRPTNALALLLFTACVAGGGRSAWHQYGVMREVMREGRDEARVALADLGPVRDPAQGELVAVGALAGLAGEVTADGRAWSISTADDGGVTVDAAPGGHAAALLTVARVPGWRATEPCSAALDEAALARLVRDSAGGASVTAVRITGHVAALDMHIVRGACPHADDAATPPWRWSAPVGTPVTLVGFFAPDAAGVLTHHGTELHLHALLSDPRDGRKLAGHVDHFTLAPGAEVEVAR